MPEFGVVCCFRSASAPAVVVGSAGSEPLAGRGGGSEPNGADEVDAAAASHETGVECSDRRGARKAERQLCRKTATHPASRSCARTWLVGDAEELGAVELDFSCRARRAARVAFRLWRSRGRVEREQSHATSSSIRTECGGTPPKSQVDRQLMTPARACHGSSKSRAYARASARHGDKRQSSPNHWPLAVTVTAEVGSRCCPTVAAASGACMRCLLIA